MRYATFSMPEKTSYEICFLVPILHKSEIARHYIAPYLAGEEEKVLAYDLYKEGKTTRSAVMRTYLEGELLPTLVELGVTYLVVGDGEYFKVLTKAPKVDPELGYVKDCVLKGFEHFKVIYVPNFRTVFHDPEKANAKIRQGMEALQRHRAGDYCDPGIDILKFAAYPKTDQDIAVWLQRLIDMDCDLMMDIEGFSLKHYDAGIGTISFAWSKNEGIAFPVDCVPIEGATEAPFHKAVRNENRRRMLRIFFEHYVRKAGWHNISYDVTVLIYQLFMDDILDTEGLLKGLEIMLRNWDCTRLITYLATNSCAGNKLSLKDQAQEYAGNYAQEEIEDITKIPLDDLLQYNLVDSCSTWFVKEKHWDTLVADQQLPTYEFFQDAMVDIIQMQLTGMPLDMKEVKKLNAELTDDVDRLKKAMKDNIWVQRFEEHLRFAWREKKHGEWKKKRIELEEVPLHDTQGESVFNPNSGPKLQELIYDENFMGLPVIDRTDTKQPATGRKTLEKLLEHTAVTDPDTRAFLELLIEYSVIDKVLTSFLPAFLKAPQGPDGWHYLFGFFNLGGTVSGRLSSSGPNLQNLPSKGKLAKRVKRCFKAPPGWLFCGLDFNSLEDMISALTTKDPAKLKVYTDGYDGHCLRAYSYFEEQMPDIDPTSVDSINSIAKLYPVQRQDSKTPTFLLTYGGTHIGIVSQLGWALEKAKKVETRYHELYKVSDQWVQAKIDKATKDGYVTVAFGLRVRTPLLAQVVRGTSRTPYEAEAEGRTAGNALGQSYCMLNTRAGIEFNRKVRTSKHRLDIRPSAHIHDAQYFLIREEMEALLFTNKHLVKACQWQEDPAIQHDTVKLGGELSVFFPTWAEEMTIPNGASEQEVRELVLQHEEMLLAA